MPRSLRISVVAYGAPDLLARSLSALDGTFPVTVVDNSSDPLVRSAAISAGAEYIDPGRNLGFGAGHNIVLRAVRQGGRPSDVLLLNPDAEITPDGLRRLQTFLLTQFEVGAVTPALVDSAGNRQRELWPFPTPFRAWREAIGLGLLNRTPDFAVGSVLLLRWELLRDHLFDERFFLYAEESDLQRSARCSGWRPALCESVTAVHVGGASSADTRRRTALFHAGTETYVRKWHGPLGWFAFRAALVAGSAVRGVVLRGERGSVARYRTRVYARGPRRVAGIGDV